MKASTVARVEALSLAHVATACSALIERARRVHDEYRAATEPAERERLRALHVRTAEALLNLLSLLEAEGSPEALVLRAGLDRVLLSAVRNGMNA